MKLLQIVRTQPDQATETLVAAMAQGNESNRFNLYESQDYDKLVEDIFAADEVISWW